MKTHAGRKLCAGSQKQTYAAICVFARAPFPLACFCAALFQEISEIAHMPEEISRNC